MFTFLHSKSFYIQKFAHCTLHIKKFYIAYCTFYIEKLYIDSLRVIRIVAHHVLYAQFCYFPECF
jgi:hypothetical protein